MSAWEVHSIVLAKPLDFAEFLESDLFAWVGEESGTFGDFRVRKDTFSWMLEAGFS